MSKQNKLPKKILEELKENPNISESMLEAARCATIHNEGWERISKNYSDIELSKVIKTGMTVGDLVK